jgi:hypothetical protein
MPGTPSLLVGENCETCAEDRTILIENSGVGAMKLTKPGTPPSPRPLPHTYSPGRESPKESSKRGPPLSMAIRHIALAKLALQAYKSESELHKLPNEQRLSACQFGSLDQKKFAGFGILEADRRAVIAFRGTVLTSCHNWGADLSCWRSRKAPLRHHGFDRAWRSMKEEVYDWIKLHKPLSITLTGPFAGRRYRDARRARSC